MRRLDQARLEDVRELVKDPSPAVVREVVAALRPVASRLNRQQLRELLLPTAAPHVRRAGLALLQQADTWSRILGDLELLEDGDASLRSHAEGDLRNWLEGAAAQYSTPVGVAAEELDSMIRCREGALGPKQERQLRFYLGLTEARPTN